MLVVLKQIVYLIVEEIDFSECSCTGSKWATAGGEGVAGCLEGCVRLLDRSVKGGCFGRWNMLAFSCEFWFAAKDHMRRLMIIHMSFFTNVRRRGTLGDNVMSICNYTR